MKELLLKDVELCRGPIAVCLMALFGPYLFWAIYLLFAPSLTGESAIEAWSLALLAASSISILLSIISIGVLAGYVVAGERRQRSSEFLAYLPPSRNRVLVSKVIVCLIWLATVGITYLVIVYVFVPWLSNGEHEFTTHQGEWYMAAGAIAVFGGAWFGSCILESPTLAVLLGLLVVPITYLILGALNLQFGWFTDSVVAQNVCAAIQTVVGLLGVGLGWLYFVRRIEP